MRLKDSNPNYDNKDSGVTSRFIPPVKSYKTKAKTRNHNMGVLPAFGVCDRCGPPPCTHKTRDGFSNCPICAAKPKPPTGRLSAYSFSWGISGREGLVCDACLRELRYGGPGGRMKHGKQG